MRDKYKKLNLVGLSLEKHVSPWCRNYTTQSSEAEQAVFTCPQVKFTLYAQIGVS
jgi:hypothetical protein